MKIPFGKYKGKEFSEIPVEYMAWLLKKDVLKGKCKEEFKKWFLENKVEELISLWVDKHYIVRSHGGGSGYDSYDMDYCPPSYDYGGDMFDAMQGCGYGPF